MSSYIDNETGQVRYDVLECLGEPVPPRFELGALVVLIGTNRVYVVCDHEIRPRCYGAVRTESDGKRRSDLRYLVQQVYVREQRGMLVPCEVDEPEWHFDHELQPVPPGSRLFEPPRAKSTAYDLVGANPERQVIAQQEHPALPVGSSQALPRPRTPIGGGVP